MGDKRDWRRVYVALTRGAEPSACLRSSVNVVPVDHSYHLGCDPNGCDPNCRLNHDQEQYAAKVLCLLCERKDWQTAEAIADPCAWHSAMRVAIERDDVEVVRQCIAKCTANMGMTALAYAIRRRDWSLASQLLDAVDTETRGHGCAVQFGQAVERGDTDAVRWLGLTQRSMDYVCWTNLCLNGSVRMLELLLEWPTVDFARAWLGAVHNNRVDCLRRLVSHPAHGRLAPRGPLRNAMLTGNAALLRFLRCHKLLADAQLERFAAVRYPSADRGVRAQILRAVAVRDTTFAASFWWTALAAATKAREPAALLFAARRIVRHSTHFGMKNLIATAAHLLFGEASTLNVRSSLDLEDGHETTPFFPEGAALARALLCEDVLCAIGHAYQLTDVSQLFAPRCDCALRCTHMLHNTVRARLLAHRSDTRQPASR